MAFAKTEQMIKSDLEAVFRDLDNFKATFREQIGDLRDTEPAAREYKILHENDLQDMQERIEQLLEQLQDMLAELRERTPYTLGRDEAVQLVATVNLLQAEINDLLALLQRVEHALLKQDSSPQSFSGKAAVAAGRAVLRIRSILQPVMQRIARRLWRLISGLLTPKEWKVGGELGNTFWGFTKANLEITFGP